METPEAQARIDRYLDAFEKQKYRQSPSPTVPLNRTYTDENKKNNLNEKILDENILDEEQPVYEEEPIFEEDPYLNDILETQPELTTTEMNALM